MAGASAHGLGRLCTKYLQLDTLPKNSGNVSGVELFGGPSEPSCATGLKMVRNALARMTRACRDVIRELTDPYRPELHYMRGPGPKWAAKHGRA
jgi:hypothetical protein